MSNIEKVLAGIEKLPSDWHKCGCVFPPFLRAVVRHTSGMKIEHSMETGSGKSTLLFSHLSPDHKVFALNLYGEMDTHSVSAVKESELFNAATVEFIEGPTQRTLPRYEFKHKLQLALIDGPHGYPFPDIEYYYIYPQLDAGALLILDDIHIPTIRNLFNFLKEDEMFELLEVVETTAFFRRTAAPLFDPYLDGWWLQAYNKKRFPVGDDPEVEGPSIRQAPSVVESIEARLPRRVAKLIRKAARPWLGAPPAKKKRAA
jgi:hypothetical protein